VKLAEFVTKFGRMRDQKPGETPLATILVRYWEGHANKMRSSVQAKIALALWNEHWGNAVVSDLTVAGQEAFIAWLKDRGYKNAYVSRVLSVGRAALNRAWKRQEIASVPFVMDERDRSDQEQAPVLNMYQVFRLLTAAREQPHLFIFCMIGLNTLARPDAILDLAPPQVSRTDRLIELNPAGRRQTKKYRPVVPLTTTLAPYLQAVDVIRYVNWFGKPVRSIKRSFAAAVKAARLPKDVTPYSLRHTMATELRRRGVPQWEVEGYLGHKAAGRVTESYAKYSPHYLSQAVQAIDSYFAELEAKFGNQADGSMSQPRASCVPPIGSPGSGSLAVLVGVRGFEPPASTSRTQGSSSKNRRIR